MNKTFKTIWNEARRSYIVTNEAQKTHGKPSKCAVALAVAATALFAGVASAAYVDPGIVAGSSVQMNEQNRADTVGSWETPEYKKDWGLAAINASTAYALGYHGQGVLVGVMDSGALMQKHPELSGDRFNATHVTGEYGASGNRYPQSTGLDGEDQEAGLPYEEGQKFDVTGNWTEGVNDTHGTHVTGTVGANRDGNEFHGVAWGSDIIVGNTGATDSNNYGPFQDYDYFYAGWKALADALVDANGADRGGVINNSWGTNIRVNGTQHFPTDTMTQTDYEYFLFKHNYADKYEGTDHAGKSFVDAAYDAVKGTNVVQIFTAGNRDFNNPFHRPLYPYFNPDAEKHWINVGGLQQDGSGNYKLWESVNEAGVAKYWTIDAPGSRIYGSITDGSGNPGYSSLSGTSMSAPHVAGSMGVLMSRYQDMNAIQVRDVLFTTASHTNPDGSVMEGWNNQDGSTPAEGEVSDRMGWGVVDLEKGMYGLGQLTGHFDYNMATTPLDVWSNDISQVALDQREREELAWKAAAEKWLANPTLTLGDEYTEEEKKLIGDIALDTDDDITGMTDEQETISEEDAIAWRTEYYNKRLEAINAKIEQGLYDGSLTKRGQGTLVMTGNNTYRGGTTVEEGMLLGFNDSFGVTGDDATATANGQVTVKGGTFGVINSYDDQFTMKGEINDEAADHSVDVTVEANGRYAFVAGQDVEVGNLTFEEGAGYTVVSLDSDVLVDAYNGITAKGSVTADNVEGIENAVARPDYAFFDTTLEVDGNTLTAYLSRNEEAPMSYASSDSERAVAAAMMAGTDSAFFATMVDSTKDQMKSTLASLGNDLHLAAQNATVVNSVTLARTIKDQASAFGQARTATLDNGAQIWVTGIGQWGNVDAGGASVDMDVDFYAGFIGGEMSYGDRNKVGVFFGYGSTDFDASADGKIESDDIHLGIYGENEWDAVGVTYGLAYTMQDRDSNRSLSVKDQVAHNAISYDADVFQVFGEASYKGFNTDSFQVEPYVGLAYMMVSSDDFTETAAGYSFRTEMEDQNLGVGTVGVRGAIPFTAGSVEMAVKGDVSYMQFFGDTEATAKMSIGDAGAAQLKGDELKGMGAVGLGVEAALGKNTKLGVSYTGAFGSDITSHGVGATLRVNF